MSEYRVQLDVFSGPLDLLLYLLRRDELDIQDIPIARVAEQYLEYVRVLEQIDPDAAGDFLVMASTLVEMKSRALLPSAPIEAGGEDEDPRATLVRRLLEYKRFKDAAKSLGSAADERAKRYVRKPVDLPRELQGVELEEVQVWDLLAAFSRVMTSIGKGPGLHQVRYDETPIELIADEIVAMLDASGPATFRSLFDGPAAKSEIIGRFLALLELVRAQRVRAEQEKVGGEIYLFLLIEAEETTDSAEQASDESLSERDAPSSGRSEDSPVAFTQAHPAKAE